MNSAVRQKDKMKDKRKYEINKIEFDGPKVKQGLNQGIWK